MMTLLNKMTKLLLKYQFKIINEYIFESSNIFCLLNSQRLLKGNDWNTKDVYDNGLQMKVA